MRVDIIALSDFREILTDKTSMTLPKDSRVDSLLELLSMKYKGFRELCFTSEGELQSMVNILVNGKNIEFKEKLNTNLSDGDTIHFFIPVDGG